MATSCDLCGRGPTSDASRSHSNIKNKKRQHLNLQTKRLKGCKVLICTKCLKTAKKYC